MPPLSALNLKSCDMDTLSTRPGWIRILAAATFLGMVLVEAGRSWAGDVPPHAARRSPDPEPAPAPIAALNRTQITNHGLEGVGRVPAASLDAFGETFGSVSALAIRDWRRAGNGFVGDFVTLPDRGFNVDGFYSDYAPRLQKLSFTFVPSPGSGRDSKKSRLSGNPSDQNQIRAEYRSTTLFRFANGDRPTGLDPGTNLVSMLGHAMPFVVDQQLGDTVFPVGRVAVDAEGVSFKTDGSGWFSDEYGPTIFRFDRDQRITQVMVPPRHCLPMAASGRLSFTSTQDPFRGRRMNQGFEALGLNPSETRLYALLQSALVQDSGPTPETRQHARLFVFDVGRGDVPSDPVGEYVVALPVFDDTGHGSKPNKIASASELVVINDTQVLVLCRDSSGLGSRATNVPVLKRIILADIAEATNLRAHHTSQGTMPVSPAGKLLPGIRPVAWVSAIDLLSVGDLSRFGFNLHNSTPDRRTFSEKWEGMALVPALDATKPDDFFLFVANDNDFMTAHGRMRQSDGLVHQYDAVGTNILRGEHDTVFLAYRLTITQGTRGGHKP